MATVQNMPLPGKITNEGSTELNFKTIAMSFGDGYEQTAPDGLNDVLEVRDVQWAPLTLTEMQTVWNVLKTVKATGILLWTPCDEVVQKQFKLADGKITRTNLGNNWKISIRVKESFDIL